MHCSTSTRLAGYGDGSAQSLNNSPRQWQAKTKPLGLGRMKRPEYLFEIHWWDSAAGISDANIDPSSVCRRLTDDREPTCARHRIKRIRNQTAENLAEQCNRCECGEARLLDGKVPLILTFKDKNKHNYHRDNIELLCYNCSFLYAASPISDEQVEQMEDYVELQVKNYDWEIDQAHIDHMKELGLWEEDKRPGDEFISRQ